MNLEGTQWTENISEGFDGRVFAVEEDDNKSYYLEFEIRETFVSANGVTMREANIVMRGHMKWDGCLNVTFTDTEINCMTHFCDVSDLDRFTDALKWVWTQGTLISAWDFLRR